MFSLLWTKPSNFPLLGLQFCFFYNRINKAVKYASKAIISWILCILISAELFTFVAENKL